LFFVLCLALWNPSVTFQPNSLRPLRLLGALCG